MRNVCRSFRANAAVLIAQLLMVNGTTTEEIGSEIEPESMCQELIDVL